MASTAGIKAPLGYLEGINSRNFSLRRHLGQYNQRLLSDPGKEGQLYRRKVTRTDPLLFAVLYLSFALANDETGGVIAFSDAHLDAYRHSLKWLQKHGPKGHRHAWFWPRNMGKSTMFFKILVMWAAAHGHRKFCVAYGGAHGPAQKHLDFIRVQGATNTKLRRDFWHHDKETGAKVIDTDHYVVAGRSLTVDIAWSNGFRMTATGINAQELGTTTEDATRPDLIIFDDIEKGEGTYTAEEAKRRRVTMTDTILPVGDSAVVEYIGTVTMAGGIADQLLTQVRGFGDPKLTSWVKAERFTVHLYEPIGVDESGIEYSTWPAKWPLSYLIEERALGSITWFKNFMNYPAAEESQWFLPQMFKHLTIEQFWAKHEPDLIICSVDPAAVEDSKKNDRWGIVTAAVNSRTGALMVLDARAGRWGPNEVRHNLDAVNRQYRIGLLLWETNQGGTFMLKSTLSRSENIEDNFLKLSKRQIIPIHQSSATAFKESSYEADQKKGRFQRMLHDYSLAAQMIFHMAVVNEQLNRLVSAVPTLEGELLSYPNGMTKDVGDALSTLIWFARHRNPAKPTAGISRGW